MAGGVSEIEWYLAREGQQHGPLSESEMRAFVDLGHLRATDLIWRAGFDEWRAAPDVFAIGDRAVEVPPAPAVAAREPEPAMALAPAPLATPDPAPHEHARHFTPSMQAQYSDFAAGVLSSPAQLAAMTGAAGAFDAAPSGPTASEPQPELVLPQAFDQRVHAPQQPAGNPARLQSKPRQAQRAPVPVQHDDFDAEYDDETQGVSKRRFGLARVAVALFVMVLAGAIFIAVMKRDMVTALLPTNLASVNLSSVAAPRTVAPFLATGSSVEVIDQNFQKAPIWRQIKQDFPEWYAERIQEALKFTAEKRGDSAIAKHLAEAVVALRRKHADQALTASPERLRFVATAFVDNLQALAKQNVETCYGFISQGETYPQVLDMLQKPDGNEGLQKQVVAVFDAISDGRKAPQTYLPPRKADYDALAAELSTLGWSENDLRTFSDPRALGRASPQQVCKMVQDWFAAQIAIKDPASQLRLLVESLRPVVAG